MSHLSAMLRKVLRAVCGLFLAILYVRIFNPVRYFKGKRVAVIGAAASSFDKEHGGYIDDFDFVIRLNKALVTWSPANEKFIGTKADILIHNFYENIDRGGGGQLDFEIFRRFNVRYVIQPRNNTEGLRQVFNFYKKYLKPVTIYLVPKPLYSKLSKLFHPLKPTMGFCALYFTLTSQCKEVFITGITFFKRPYAVGYRDHLLDMDANRRHIEQQRQHDPELEFRLFKSLLLQATSATISVDSELYHILNHDSFVGLSKIQCK